MPHITGEEIFRIIDFMSIVSPLNYGPGLKVEGVGVRLRIVCKGTTPRQWQFNTTSWLACGSERVLPCKKHRGMKSSSSSSKHENDPIQAYWMIRLLSLM